MKFSEFPGAKSASRFAIMAALSGCASQQATPQVAPHAATLQKAECDRSARENIKVITSEPGRTVFSVCGTPYVAETRGEGDEQEVGVKVCKVSDLSNMRIEKVSESKSIGRICNYTYVWESTRPAVSYSTTRTGASFSSTQDNTEKKPCDEKEASGDEPCEEQGKVKGSVTGVETTREWK